MGAGLLAALLLAGCGRDTQPAAGEPDRQVDGAEPAPRTAGNESDFPADQGVAAGPAPRAADPAADSNTIPPPYRGRWATSVADCGSPYEGELTLTADRLRFWESEGRVEAVQTAGPRAIRVEAAFTGEGEAWRRDHRLQLDENGRRLTVSGAGMASVRVRCP